MGNRTVRTVTALVVFATACASALTVALVAPASAGPVKPGPELIRAKAAIAGQSSVHVIFTAHTGSSSSVAEKIFADVGTKTGNETVLEGGADLAIRVTPAFAYVSGNSAGFTTLFGMSAADAKKVGKRWETWKAGSKQYANLVSDVTMSSVSGLLPEAKGTTLSVGPTTDVFKWTAAATSSVPELRDSLTLSAATNLPATAKATSASGTSVTTTLSHWGAGVVVKTPPAASRISASRIKG